MEAIAPDHVRGWAFDPAQPDAHLTVTIYSGDTELGSGIANIPRHDLSSAGIGQGDHGFSIASQNSVDAAMLERIRVVARSGSATIELRLASPGAEVALNSASNAAIAVADDRQYPVFVLGPARSGTSALTLALLKTRRYEGFGEGHLLPLALELLHAAHRYYGTFAAHERQETFIKKVPVRTFERMVRRAFVQLTRTSFPSGYWIDKTPTVEMVRAAPLMREIWPNARFIFLKRRVIENVLSRVRKFPQDTVEAHYSDWLIVMQAWLEVRHQLKDACIEIDQVELARDPEKISARLASFLGMTDEQHQSLLKSLREDRPEQTSQDVGMVNSIEDLKLSDQDRQMLTDQCQPVMAALGYTFGPGYYA